MIARLTRGPGLYLFILLFYSIGLWKISVPLTGDQKTYLSIALEMRERGEWIIPYLFNVANFLKPPLQYWATLVGWKIFGFNLFGALFPSVLALVASSFLISRLSAFVFKESLAPAAALFFAGTIGTMTYGTTSQMEIWIVLFYLLAWERWLSGKIWTALIVVGVMAWIKGPLYPVLWVLSSWIWMFLERRTEILKRKTYWLALAAGIGVGLLWYALAARTHLQEMKEVFLLRENVGKIQTSQGSPGKLWGDFIFSLFPALLWLLLVLLTGRKKIAQHLGVSGRNFIFSYAALPAAFFAFFPYRVGTYLYLLTPVMAWLAACSTPGLTLEEDQPVEKETLKNTGLETKAIKNKPLKSKVHLVLAVFTSVLTVLFVFFTFRFMQGNWIGIEIGFPLLICLGAWSYSFWKFNVQGVALTGFLLVNLIRMSAVEIGEKDLMGLRGYQAEHPGNLAYVIEDQDIWHEFGYISSALSQDIDRLEANQVNDYLKIGGSVILNDAQNSDSHWICVQWPRLRRRIKFPVQSLLLKGLSVEDESLLRNYKICRLQ